jgi:phenylpyruvate tautomerase PptA (4-oxalocrotonate tautomerase family)
MPVVEINTNTSISNKQEVAVKASKLIAKLLGKPEEVSNWSGSRSF